MFQAGQGQKSGRECGFFIIPTLAVEKADYPAYNSFQGCQTEQCGWTKIILDMVGMPVQNGVLV
jgi:hypothetical protein